MMKKFIFKNGAMWKHIVLATCCAFTVEVMSFVILPEALAPRITIPVLSQTFILSFLGASTVVILSSIDFKSIWTFYLVSYLSLASVVFGVGSFVFDLIPLKIPVYLSVLVTFICIYVVNYFVMCDRNRNDAEIINRYLQEQKGKR